MTVLAGTMSNISFMWIIVATILVIGGCLHAWNALDDFIKKNSIKDKLIFAGPSVEIANSKRDDTREISLGIQLRNCFSKKILYKVENMSAIIAGRSVEEPKLYNTGCYVSPSCVDIFRFDWIKDVPFKDYFEGTMDYEVKYGLSEGELKHKLKQKIKLCFHRASDGTIAIRPFILSEES